MTVDWRFGQQGESQGLLPSTFQNEDEECSFQNDENRERFWALQNSDSQPTSICHEGLEWLQFDDVNPSKNSRCQTSPNFVKT